MRLNNNIRQIEGILKRLYAISSLSGEQITKEKIDQMLRAAMQAPSARNQQPWEFYVVTDREKIEALARSAGAAFCLSGAGPTLLCITRNPGLEEKLAKKLDSITTANWQMLPLHVEFQGAHVISAE